MNKFLYIGGIYLYIEISNEIKKQKSEVRERKYVSANVIDDVSFLSLFYVLSHQLFLSFLHPHLDEVSISCIWHLASSIFPLSFL